LALSYFSPFPRIDEAVAEDDAHEALEPQIALKPPVVD
jgi:hypothetical protein